MSFLEQLRAIFHRLSESLNPHAKDAHPDVMNEVREELAELGETVEAFVTSLKGYAAEHPESVFAILRKLQPILVKDNVVLVTRFEDVEEVLTRDDVFDVPYAEKMRLITNGENFFLGMADSPRYTQDHSNMRIVVRREDIPERIAPLVLNTAEAVVARAPGRLDVVRELSQIVPTRFVASYFGTPGPSEPELIDWTTTLFWFLFLDQQNDPNLRERAVSASGALNGYLDRAIALRKATPVPTDDVLNRCLKLQTAGTPGMSDLDIRNNFVGLIVGAIPTTATAIALVLDELLRRPAELSAAQKAARADDDDLFANYLFEAFRFNPMAPAIFRSSNQDFTLAKGELRATHVPAGATVVAATQSAMFDSHRVDAPESFQLGRVPRDAFQFGHGLHTCFGQYINRVQIPGILKPLLRRQNLRRAEGEAGQYVKAGPLAGSLSVLFDP